MKIGSVKVLPKKIQNNTAILWMMAPGTKTAVLPEAVKNYLPAKYIKTIIHSQEELMTPLEGLENSYLFSAKVNGGKIHTDYFRRYFYLFMKGLVKKNFNSVYICLPESEELHSLFESELYLLQTAVEGVIYASYSFSKYKSSAKAHVLPEVIFVSSDTKNFQARISYTQKLMESVFFARLLANEPANILTPDAFAKICKKELSSRSVKMTIWNEKVLKTKKMGGILAVGGGSDNKPRMIIMQYRSAKRNAPHVAVVGKGVCFDSGGISIKPAEGMGKMKADMAGGAVAAGLIKAANELKLPYNITVVIPAVENMLSGSAMRPGDIVRTSSGKTIEVDNTDAEGRMILADALHYASKLKPDLLIDLATLTGASAVALAEFVTSMFAHDDTLADTIYKAGLKTYERVWRMPLWDDYNKLIESDVADVKNVGGRWGGAVTAAKFLENWVSDPQKWIHLDIAGPSMPQTITPYNKTYMSGTGVRLLVEFLNSDWHKALKK